MTTIQCTPTQSSHISESKSLPTVIQSEVKIQSHDRATQCDWIPGPPAASHTRAVQCDSVYSKSHFSSASLLTDHSSLTDNSFPAPHSLSTNDSQSADQFFSRDHSFTADHSSSASQSTAGNISSIPTRGYKFDHSSTISVSELESLGITRDCRLGGLLACLKNGSDVYTIMDKKNPYKMIATLTVRPDDTIDITTRDGKLYSLIDATATTFFLASSLSTKSTCNSNSSAHTLPERISIAQFDDLGILRANLGHLVSVGDDGTQDYSVTDPDTKEQIAILSIRPNRAVEVIKNGKIYALTNPSGKPVTLPPFTRPQQSSSTLYHELSSPAIQRPPSPPLKRSSSPVERSSSPSPIRRCFWCDLFDHEIPRCPQLLEDIRSGKVYITDDGIMNASTNERLPLAVGRGGMRSFL